MISSEIVKKVQQTMYAEQYMHHVYHEPIPTANQRGSQVKPFMNCLRLFTVLWCLDMSLEGSTKVEK